MQWRQDATSAVAEDFGDEVVVMNLATGSFYSLRGRAADTWRCCASGASVEALATAIAALPQAEAELLTGMLDGFVSTGVLSIIDDDEPAAASLGDEPAEITHNDDFNDLIRLDPSHDVDDRGWPFKG